MEKKKYKYDDVTVIRIRRQTREKLADIGKKEETCDDIVCRLIENDGHKKEGGLHERK